MDSRFAHDNDGSAQCETSGYFDTSACLPHNAVRFFFSCVSHYSNWCVSASTPIKSQRKRSVLAGEIKSITPQTRSELPYFIAFSFSPLLMLCGKAERLKNGLRQAISPLGSWTRYSTFLHRQIILRWKSTTSLPTASCGPHFSSSRCAQKGFGHYG